MNGLRLEFQDRVNFVILDWDNGSTDRAFARTLNLTSHPSFATFAPNSNDVVGQIHGAPRTGQLSDLVEEIVAAYAE